jgi:hypothetical protein
MERRLSIPVGVVVERTATGSAWQSRAWRPAAAMIGGTALEPGSRLRQDDATASYFAGNAALELFPTEIESYCANLAQEVPRLYVVLSVPGTLAEDETPVVHLVTAAPDEAESYLDGDGRLVDGVPMAPALIELISAYVAAHPIAPALQKRRLRAQPEAAEPPSRLRPGRAMEEPS